MKAADVIVVGAGIVGAAVAERLADAALDVLVIDAGRPAATAAGMGHLLVMDDDAAEFALCRDSLQRWDHWAPQLGADCAFVRCGTLWLAASDDDWRLARTRQARLQAHGLAAELFDAVQLHEAEPALRPGLLGALRVGGDSMVYAPNVVRWLLQQAARSVRCERAEVVRIEQGSVRLRDGSRRHAAAVVLATGADVRRLCPELPIRPKKGQLVITDRYPGQVRHQLVELGYAASAHASAGSSVAFNLQPRPTGQLLIGSSRQFDAHDSVVDDDLLARMIGRALEYMPALAGLNAIRAWTGQRAATPDGLPLIGAHPWRRGLWLAIGHEGLGVTLAPGTAQLLASLMLGTTAPAVDAAPFSPARFAAARP